MANKNTIKGDTIERYMSEFPDEFNRALARKIYQENPDIFDSLEQVRSAIRYRKGSLGDKHRNYKGIKKEGYRDIYDLMQQYKLKTEAEEPKVFTFDKAVRRLGVLSDIHIPYHNLEAVAVAVDYLKKKEIDTLLINGDLVDFYQVSSFNRDPSRKDIWYEIQMVKEFLDFLNDTFPGVRKYWKLGNHEERLFTFIKAKAPELYGIPMLSFEELFQLNDHGVEIIGGHTRILAGKLNILHGHEFGRSFFNPVNPARGLFLRSKSSALAGHNHQTSEHHENNLNNDALACWSTGCLCELTPDYRPFGYLKWNHGAAFVEIDKDGRFHVDNFRIKDGRIL